MSGDRMEWRIVGDPGPGYQPYSFVFKDEGEARGFMALVAKCEHWTDGPHLEGRTVIETDWERADGIPASPVIPDLVYVYEPTPDEPLIKPGATAGWLVVGDPSAPGPAEIAEATFITDDDGDGFIDVGEFRETRIVDGTQEDGNP